MESQHLIQDEVRCYRFFINQISVIMVEMEQKQMERLRCALMN